MDRSFLFIAILSFYCVYAKITIIDLVVPQSIEYTDDNITEIILDCNYDAEHEEELEVKWYHNSFTNPIYQWIPSSNKKGEALGVYKYHLDLDYRVVDHNQRTLYRALKLTNITRDLMGNYTCQISSIYNEVRETKQLILYSPAKSGIDMNILDKSKEIVCTAEDIYPTPNMEVYVTDENDRIADLPLEKYTHTNMVEDEFGFYTVNLTLKFWNLTGLEDIGNPAYFICKLTIPGTNYSEIDFVEYDTEEMKTFERLIEDGNYNISVVNDYDAVNSTEDNFNTTQGNNAAVVHFPALCLSTLLLVLLLVVSK